MEFQIDISREDRTEEQEALLQRYYEAAKLLRSVGYKAKVYLHIVTRPTDSPACIEIEEG